ncbi:hypothetical protein [Pseudonocardia asaccharolytica]|uniref:Uncharacterized protein n=1 Tax=Pseudonocardia asaccharolytica DSM 44247 = NBRC 16224 TaxID=1123024 RepID=A0A511CZM1_9PSEU|nr:hypothetical protein [Pseudonocardia asaccharolytica]GEL18000.1 hypothetical protein PA7_18370 [Pseudonocardia asaccharolytica DSM 44247 = NBRC 16224]
MARFRLFGRNSVGPGAPPTPPWLPYGPGQHPSGYGPPPSGWTAGPPDDHGPATRAARPAYPAPFRAAGLQREPLTDPHGFPPVAAGPDATPHPAEAAALAGAFAVDYLSWDEDDPDRRGFVLADYLPAPVGEPARLGWSGAGRQRAELALPGRVRPDGEDRVLVDVRVRITPYRPVGNRTDEAPAQVEPEIAGTPAVAPAPTGRGWRSLASYWVRISVPVAVYAGRLVVDVGKEALDDKTPSTEHRDTGDADLPRDDHPEGAW